MTEVCLEVGNTYNRGQWSLFVRLVHCVCAGESPFSLRDVVTSIDARLHESFQRQHIRLKFFADKNEARWGPARSSGVFDIPIRMTLRQVSDRPGETVRFIDVTHSLVIGRSANSSTSVDSRNVGSFGSSSKKIRFRTALPKDRIHASEEDDSEYNSDSSVLEEE